MPSRIASPTLSLTGPSRKAHVTPHHRRRFLPSRHLLRIAERDVPDPRGASHDLCWHMRVAEEPMIGPVAIDESAEIGGVGRRRGVVRRQARPERGMMSDDHRPAAERLSQGSLQPVSMVLMDSHYVGGTETPIACIPAPDIPVVVHHTRGFSHARGGIAVEREVGPERGAQDPDVADADHAPLGEGHPCLAADPGEPVVTIDRVMVIVVIAGQQMDMHGIDVAGQVRQHDRPAHLRLVREVPRDDQRIERRKPVRIQRCKGIAARFQPLVEMQVRHDEDMRGHGQCSPSPSPRPRRASTTLPI